KSRARLHAEQGLVALRIILVRVMQVVGCKERDAEILRDVEQLGLNSTFDLKAVIHDLAVEIVFAENVLELCGRGAGLIELAQSQAGVDLTGGATGRCDDTLRVALQELTIEARLEVVAFDGCEARQSEEIMHPLGAAG